MPAPVCSLGEMQVADHETESLSRSREGVGEMNLFPSAVFSSLGGQYFLSQSSGRAGGRAVQVVKVAGFDSI